MWDQSSSSNASDRKLNWAFEIPVPAHLQLEKHEGRLLPSTGRFSYSAPLPAQLQTQISSGSIIHMNKYNTYMMKSYLWETESFKKANQYNSSYLWEPMVNHRNSVPTTMKSYLWEPEYYITSPISTELALVVLSLQFIIHQWTQYDSPINIFLKQRQSHTTLHSYTTRLLWNCTYSYWFLKQQPWPTSDTAPHHCGYQLPKSRDRGSQI